MLICSIIIGYLKCEKYTKHKYFERVQYSKTVSGGGRVKCSSVIEISRRNGSVT